MSTKGREKWEKFKAGYVVDSSYAEEPNTGNAGRDRWNALKKTIDIRSTAPRQTAQDDSSGAKKGFFDRLGLTVSGGAKGSLAGNMDAMGVAYEAGQSGRTKRDTAELKDAQWAVARAKHDYDADPSEVNKSALEIATTKMKAFADVLGEGAYEQALEAAYDAAAQFDTGDLKALYNSLGVVTPKTGTGVQQQAANAARALAARVQDSATEDIREAKDGTSKFWQMAIDAGASATQMALDAASNAVLGTNGSMVPFATRAFGGATMEARQGGADLGKQALYGAAQTAKEVFTEKMFNIALPYAKTYGKGGFDGIVENGIRKAADKLGKSKIGKAALEKVLTFGASAATEGMEELIGDWMEWQLPRIYGGDVATAEETLSDSLYDFVVGFMSGMIGGAMTEPMKAINSAVQAQEVKKTYGAQQWDLVNESEELSPGNELAKKYRERLDGGKNLSGRQLIRLMQQNETDMLNGDKAKIQAATEKRLTELGESDNVRQLAEIVARQMAGEELSRDEQMQIDGSKYGKRVLNELNPSNIRSGGFASGWAKSIGTNTINYAEYNADLMSLAGDVAGVSTSSPVSASKESAPTAGSLTPAAVAPSTERFTASESGKLTNKKTGADLGKVEITSSDGKSLKLKTESGEIVDAKDVDFRSKDEAMVYSAVLDMGVSPVVAQSIVDNFDGTDGMVYAADVNLAYQYGKMNFPKSYLDKLDIKPRQAEHAYNLGRSDAKAEAVAPKTKRTVKGKRGTVIFETAVDESTMTPIQKASLNGIKAIADLSGLNFHVFESRLTKDGYKFTLPDGTVTGANGWYVTGTNDIWIDMNAGNAGEGTMLYTAAHEISHFIKEWSPTKWRVLADFLLEQYGEDVPLDALLERQMAKVRKNNPDLQGNALMDAAYEELVSDAMSEMLVDGEVVQKLAELKQKDKTLWEKIKDAIRDLLEKWGLIRKEYEGRSVAGEAEFLRGMDEAFKKLQQLYTEAFADADANFSAAEDLSTDTQPVETSVKHSFRSLAEAAGFGAMELEDGTKVFLRDRQRVSRVTLEDIENSPIGAMINFSVDMKDITTNDADRQKEMFRDVCNMAIKTGDFNMTMQFAGSAVFTGMKANADKQYGTTYDFPSICTKTQAVIDAMSARMVKLGRGLSSDEIVEIYRKVFASGNPVPCPECYVFSRWIGIGGLLDNIKTYQDTYGKMSVDEAAASYDKLHKQIEEIAKEKGISFGKAKGKLASDLQKEYNKLKERIEKNQNQGEKVKPADAKLLADLEPMMTTVKALTWLENVYFADEKHTKINKNFRVPDNVLFDLNNGEAFATQYKEAWAFRTTQGAGYGKAITPYAEARLGEGILVTNNTANAIKGKAKGTLKNYFLDQKGRMDGKAVAALKKARAKQKNQAFIGGQRFQSTSDARYENASDYLLAALEMQAMGGMVQVYTKVDGAVPAFSAWGFSINQSLMPLGGGLDANGNVKDTSTGGMNPDVAFRNREKHETAGTITIGVNDNHIRKMFAQWERDFIIPYHASGGKATIVAEFRDIQEKREAKGAKVRSTDYSRTQSDKVLSDEVLRWMGRTEDEIRQIHAVRDARIAILTGKSPNMDVVRGNRFLSNLYDKLRTKDGEWYGVVLAKGKVEGQIFPNEFWDQSVSYEDSAKITEDYLAYCKDLGILHRFSGMVPQNGILRPVTGYNERGERVQLTDLAYKYKDGEKTAEVEPFFWKVLTDRRMYDNSKKYLPQKRVTLNDTTTDTVATFATGNYGRQYNKELSQETAAKLADAKLSTRDADGDYDIKLSDRDDLTYAEITEKQRELYQREMNLSERKREANSNPELLQAMDAFYGLSDEMRELLQKRRQGTATQEDLGRIEEIKVLRDVKLQQVVEIQERLGLKAMEAEDAEIRQMKEDLRVASDAAWKREGAERESAAIAKAGVSAPEYFRKKALKSFKTTTNFNEAGYLLPDGKLLNFSGGERNHRYRDHREIGEIYEATQGAAALNRFMSDGNIRIMAESPGVDITSGVEPTKEQYAAIRRFVNANGVKSGKFFVDFSDAEGHRAGNYFYEGRVSADRVINDIKHFYATGEIRAQSAVAQFRYSDRDYLDAVNRGDMETAQRMVDEAARAAGYTSQPLYHGSPNFGFTKIDTAKSDDKLSFFTTDSLEVAETYSGKGEVNQISEGAHDDIEAIEEAFRDKQTDLCEYINRAAGYQSYIEYDWFDKYWEAAAHGSESMDDIRDKFDEDVDEIIQGLFPYSEYYERISDDGVDQDELYDEFVESEEIQRIYSAANDLEFILMAARSDNSGNYRFYARTENLFEIDAKGKSWAQIPFDQYDKNGFHPVVNTRQLARYAKENGFDGVKITSVFDDGGRSVKHQRTPATVYIFFNPQEQVKSADPVTYDDDGNVIPLSKRFNPENNDIRYSDRDSAYQSEEDINRLRNEIEEIDDEMLFAEGSEEVALRNKRVKLQYQLDKLLDAERRAAKPTSLQTVLDNLKKYRRGDLESIANQLTDGAWDEIDDLPTDALIDGIREVIKGRELSPLEMQVAKFGVYARDVSNWKYSDRDIDSVSNRDILANAFMDIAQNDVERGKIAEYQQKIKALDEDERKLRDIRAQLHDLSFSAGPRDNAKIRKLREKATKLANRIGIQDKQLLRLEASKPLMAVLDREKKLAYSRASQKWEDRIETARTGRSKTEMRHKIKKIVGELNNLLLHGTKDKHIMIGLQKATAEALSAINMDTVAAEKRLAKIQAKIDKATDPAEKARLQQSYARVEAMGDNMATRLTALKNAYEEIKDSGDPLVANAYQPEIEERIKNLRKMVGDTPLRNMSMEQLEFTYDTYKMVLTTIRNANKAFKNERGESIAVLGNRAMEEIGRVGGKKELVASAMRGPLGFAWSGMKPTYAFKAIGSDTLSELFSQVRAGEDVWATDVNEAKEFYSQKTKQYHYDSWDLEKEYTFTSKSGKEFKLTLEQIMSLYAYSKRKQADAHLDKGGFVYDSSIEVVKRSKLGIPVKYRVNTAHAHALSRDTLMEICKTLTDEQVKFVDEMQDYLSTVMGEKGNEVSLKMYGVKLFKEKFYFPLKSAKQFMYEQYEVAGDRKIKNSGFSKDTTPHASNPVILNNFTDVWATHVNDMAMYHAFVLPMEDFERVFNYKTPTSDTMPTESVKGYLQDAYGVHPEQYIKQLMTDLNGGARIDPTAGIINKGIALFKKSAVFSSLSVVIQQPSAIARAMAYIDAKYFVGKPGLKDWDEVKKYAPVAIIKEMGYFDTNMGKSTVEFIKAKEYTGVKSKMKALVTDSQYRDEILSKAPSVADELAWCQIWNAVKKEIAETKKLQGEELLQAAGKRFTEVIVNTQVYDSVLTRSGMMRSKDTGMKMATSFMAEPTTSLNMIADALIQGKRGNKSYARKAIGAVAASMILNSILVSFVYAGRDDDEDKTYIEKYAGSLTSELIDSFNPLTLIPFVKDIVSIAQGYDVERSDMAVITDLFNAWKKLSSDNLSVYRKVEGFGGTIASIFGLPLKNIMRDVRGIYNTVKSAVAGPDTTGRGVLDAARESLPKWMGGGERSNADQLYAAMLSGDTGHVERLKARFKDDRAFTYAVRDGLVNNDKRITAAAEARAAGNQTEYMRLAREIVNDGHFSQDDVVRAVNYVLNRLTKKES